MKNSSECGALLRACRGAVDANVRALGPHARLPARWGKRVTQEEVAEAAGVSRVWYAMLESGAAVRTSPRLLDSLAAALMLSARDRAALFCLALPELELGRERATVVESCRLLRGAAKRLWSATSEPEAMTAVCEQLATWFDDATLVTRLHRRATGAWDWECVVDRGPGGLAGAAWEELTSAMTPAEIDRCFLFPQLVEAGDVGGADRHPAAMRRRLLATYRRRDLLTIASFLQGRVRSRRGAIAGFLVSHKLGRAYSTTDSAVIGTLAELTSLALA